MLMGRFSTAKNHKSRFWILDFGFWISDNLVFSTLSENQEISCWVEFKTISILRAEQKSKPISKAACPFLTQSRCSSKLLILWNAPWMPQKGYTMDYSPHGSFIFKTKNSPMKMIDFWWFFDWFSL